MNKKLQIFVSSTYLDLKEERQKAVEGILRAGHIPAGMELFSAASKSQWKVIENWIKESDVLLLMFGGRYGSIDEKKGKSYTHLEYEYAQKHNIPVFSIVLSDQYLANKKSKNISLEIYERDVSNPQINKYDKFKKLVEKNLVAFVDDINLIPNEITLTLKDFIEKDTQEYQFKGWIRGNEILIKEDQNQQNGKRFEMDERLLEELIGRIESGALLQIIEGVYTSYSYTSTDRKEIDDFIEFAQKPTTKFFSNELNIVLKQLIISLNKFNFYLLKHFFPRRIPGSQGYYLYPDFNIDLDGHTKEHALLFDKYVEELDIVCTDGMRTLKEYAHKSRLILY